MYPCNKKEYTHKTQIQLMKYSQWTISFELVRTVWKEKVLSKGHKSCAETPLLKGGENYDMSH